MQRRLENVNGTIVLVIDCNAGQFEVEEFESVLPREGARSYHSWDASVLRLWSEPLALPFAPGPAASEAPEPVQATDVGTGLREISTHKVNACNEAIRITVLDDPGAGGANHVYRLAWPADPTDHIDISFQNGPIGEAGVNGVTQEAILAVVVDRLEGFQHGPYANAWNQEALNHIRKAIEVLQSRTLDRVARGVEGTHTV